MGVEDSFILGEEIRPQYGGRILLELGKGEVCLLGDGLLITFVEKFGMSRVCRFRRMTG
jgi:hypothetical protein